MSNILSQVTLDAVTRKKDKSITLRFVTQLEQTSEQLMEMDKLLSDSGHLFFKSNGNLTKEEIKELDNVETEIEGKTKSQRLRNVLYVLYEQTEGFADGGDFNGFYGKEMEKIIEHYKSKLD